ncbi:Uncharacterised protein [Vibrio cholerae]|nr:Uncharacterised protein [Vibrio cholerae]CSB84420.1 Uncharacterised protein [Vibrio cholerae]
MSKVLACKCSLSIARIFSSSALEMTGDSNSTLRQCAGVSASKF